MKIDSYHLTYCTNIHPGESWQEVFANLQQYLPILKNRLSVDAPFGIGLRLAFIAAKELLQGDNLINLQSWLKEHNLYIFTLNGFPYGSFHREIVKDKVYAPDWTTKERLEYTLILAKILTKLLPEGMDGGISTVPLSYKPWWKKEEQRDVYEMSSLNLAQTVAYMVNLRKNTGKLLHVDLEPEPDGLIENSQEVIEYFHNSLIPIGTKYLSQQLDISLVIAERYLREHIRLCYDTCHFAVAYEQPELVFNRLQTAGIKIGKIQISAALKVDLPEDLSQRKFIAARLKPFAESTYLHQVIERHSDGSFQQYRDLQTALPQLLSSQAKEWRTHFHVPIFLEDYQILQSTQADIAQVLQLLNTHPSCNHLEIETYTWDILPSDMKQDLLTSIQREYQWVLGKKY